MIPAPVEHFTCIECKARAGYSLKCASRDDEHAYLHLPPNNDNQGRADEVEGDMA